MAEAFTRSALLGNELEMALVDVEYLSLSPAEEFDVEGPEIGSTTLEES
jgi:hypothetical protein